MTSWVRTLRIVAVVLVSIAALRVAWLSDDALITLRTALNITHGWGPGYNTTEAVQGYTHPLWFLAWVAIGSWSNQWIVGLLGISLLATAGAVALLVWRTSSPARLILVTGFLLFSNAFIEYATSGLENSLAYLTVGLLLAIAFADDARSGLGRRPPLLVTAALGGLTVAAVILTRFDLALLILPVVLLLIFRARKQWRALAVAAGAGLLPLVAWFLWSQAAYSTWLPNTFEAKRNVDIPQGQLLVQGFRYLYVSFEHDPVTLIALLTGCVAALAVGSRLARAAAIGVALYLGYVVWIGGDFMAGRFLAVPVYVAMFLLATLPASEPSPSSSASNAPKHESASIAISVGAVAVMLVASSAAGATPTTLSNSQEERWAVDQNFNAGVDDERGVYAANGRTFKSLLDNLSLAYVNPNIVGIGDGTGLNRSLREINQAAAAWPERPSDFTLPSEVGVFCGFLGTIGIATGPITHLIDSCALTDRFLASRPFVPASPYAWKPGHFARAIPDGYVEAVATGDATKLGDPRDRFELSELWSRIR